MITLNKILLCTGLVVLLLAVAKIASAQPGPADGMLGEREIDSVDLMSGGPIDPPPIAVPAELLLNARGFAAKDNEKRTLELFVESRRHVEPALIRRLLSSNKSLEEIREMIGEEQGQAAWRGAIRVDKRLYLLMNIQLLASFEDTTLDADVVQPGFGKAIGTEMAVIGHLTVIVGPSNSGRIGQGKLTMIGGEQPGSYEVQLETWADGQGQRINI
jgi:hypothetical protein